MKIILTEFLLILTNILCYNVYVKIETSISISLYGDFFPFSLMNVPFLLHVPMLSLTTHLPERDIYKKSNYRKHLFEVIVLFANLGHERDFSYR